MFGSLFFPVLPRRQPVLDQVGVQVAPAALGVTPVDHRPRAPVRVTLPGAADRDLLPEDEDLDEVPRVAGDLPLSSSIY